MNDCWDKGGFAGDAEVEARELTPRLAVSNLAAGHDNPELLETLREILVWFLGVPAEFVVPDATFEGDFGVGQREKMRIGKTLERAFDVTLPCDSIDRWRNIGDAMETIERAQVKRASERAEAAARHAGLLAFDVRPHG